MRSTTELLNTMERMNAALRKTFGPDCPIASLAPFRGRNKAVIRSVINVTHRDIAEVVRRFGGTKAHEIQEFEFETRRLGGYSGLPQQCRSPRFWFDLYGRDEAAMNQLGQRRRALVLAERTRDDEKLALRMAQYLKG